jgi:competence protein ComEC
MAARRKRRGGVASTVVAIVIIILLVIYNQFFGGGGERATEVVEGSIEIYIFDVGQADCTLIRSEAGNILIDAGDTDTQDEVVEMILSAGVSELEYVIFTHPDSDHIGGADEVVKGIDIKNVILPVIDESDIPTTRVYENMIASIEERESINVIAAESGAEYAIGELKMKILAPNSDNYSNINDYSVSARFDFGSTSFLFTGDALEKSEGEMLDVWPVSELDCDFFQAGHHGAANANTPDFIKAVSPDIVAVSCGKDNKYGHPTEEALAAYASVGATVYRTDELGTIVFTSDGTTITKK